MRFTDQFVSNISAGFAEIERGEIEYRSQPSAQLVLGNLWNPSRVEEPATAFIPSTRWPGSPRPEKQQRPPPWFIGWTKDFANSVDRIDRKLQGRILQALVDIASNPIELRGDTQKPMLGDLKGCWRYRIADYRIVYSPDSSTGNITLLAFGARSSIYSD